MHGHKFVTVAAAFVVNNLTRSMRNVHIAQWKPTVVAEYAMHFQSTVERAS